MLFDKKTLIYIAVLIITLDQWAKAWVVKNIPHTWTMDLIPNFIELKHMKNKGIAFSMLDSAPIVLTIVISIIMLVLFWYIVTVKDNYLFFAFLLGGGLSNLIDRYIYGEVTDYINPLFVDFAVFNLADVALNIGMVLFLLNVLKGQWKRK